MESDTRDGTFARQLDALKQRGCALLVVNDAESSPAVCHRLLGDPGERRRHLFVPTTTTVASVLDRRSSLPRTPETLGIVDGTAADRTRATAAPQGPGTIDTAADWYTELDRLDDLATLGARVDEHLARFERAGPLAPGEVRLCLESLDPFIDLVADETLFRFLHLLTARVRGLRGIVHVHAADVSREAVALYEPLFDATVSVRSADGEMHQRWRLQESGYDSDWLVVDRENPSSPL